jgi:hypothetical protein
LDDTVSARYETDRPTVFRVARDADGHAFGEIVFGPDIYPGKNVIDPNSALSLLAAAAHELAHYHRWADKTELPPGPHDALDEALTSLEAILRYRRLQDHDVRQLIADAIQRIQLYLREQAASAG